MSIMLREINEQPAMLERTIRNETKKLEKIGRFLKDRNVELIVLVARGSSDNAALFARYLFETTCGIPVSLSAPSVYTLYKSKMRLKHALVIGVSQSGEGSDINEVLVRARKSGAFTLGITNNPRSAITRSADETLLIHVGKEKSVAATKTYTGQMLNFYLLANALGSASRRIEIERIPDYVEDALKKNGEVKALAERYTFMENCVVVGRGLNYGNSFELALKLMETCYVVAERFSSADFFHGPLAIVERRFPVILFGSAGVTKKSNVALLRRLRQLNADSFSITNDNTISQLSSRAIMMDADMEERLTPIPFVVPAQMFAAHLSESKGLDPDRPRSLSKVTRTL